MSESELFQFLQRQHFDPCRGRLLRNIHEFAGPERIRNVLAGRAGRTLDGLDLQEAWQGEFADASFLDMTINQGIKFIQYGSDFFPCQAGILRDAVEDLGFCVFFLDCRGCLGGCFFSSRFFCSHT